MAMIWYDFLQDLAPTAPPCKSITEVLPPVVLKEVRTVTHRRNERTGSETFHVNFKNGQSVAVPILWQDERNPHHFAVDQNLKEFVAMCCMVYDLDFHD